jgi:hypothetical protein
MTQETAQPTAQQDLQAIDPKTIATLMSRHLKPQGVAVQVAMADADATLQVLLEGIDAPGQDKMTAFVTTGLQKMGTPGITQLQIFGRRSGDAEPAWIAGFASQENNAWVEQPLDAGVSFGAGDLGLRCRQGQSEAIAQFVDLAIQAMMADTGDRITETSSGETTPPIESFVHLDEAGLLHVTIQTAQFLDGPAFAAQFGGKMNEIASARVKEVALYKRKTLEATPFLIKQMTLHRSK